jgi:YVTN family beta-propeller protein
VKVGSYPRGVTVTPDGTKVYVTNSGSNTVSVIDASNNKVTATINLGSPAHGGQPEGVAVTPDGTKVYVVNFGGYYDYDTVSVIDTTNNTVIATVNVGAWPEGIAINPKGTMVYVTNSYSNTVSVIDAATNTVTATVPVGNYPFGVSVTPDGMKVYVGNVNSNNVSVIDTATNRVTATVNVGNNPYAFGQFIGIPPAPMPACSPSTIYGYSFDDSNINKKKNSREAGFSKTTINLNGYNTCKGKLISETTKTDPTGYYEFKSVDPGVYVVSESFAIGWLPTTSAAYTLTVPSNSTSIRKDFGNVKFVK